MRKHLAVFAWIVLSCIWVTAQNPRNVVLYDLTSTDCGHCSCMDSLIRETILMAYPRTIPIALHSPYMASHFKDYQGNGLFYTFNSTLAPAGYLDGLGEELTWHQTFDSVASRYTSSPEAPVSLAVTAKIWDPVSRNVAITMNMTNIGSELSGNFRCQVFVTENNLKATHRVENGCATPDDTTGLPFRSEYFNDHVVRKVEFIPDTSVQNPVWGDSLIAPSWPAGGMVTKTWTVSIDTGWVEANCFLNIVIYKDNQDSLYKSEHLQAISESVTGAIGIDQPPTGIPQNGITLIYPNPGKDWVNIHFSVAEGGNCSFEIFDLYGRLVETVMYKSLAKGIYHVEYQVSTLPAGIYLWFFRSPQAESTGKLVIE